MGTPLPCFLVAAKRRWNEGTDGGRGEERGEGRGGEGRGGEGRGGAGEKEREEWRELMEGERE